MERDYPDRNGTQNALTRQLANDLPKISVDNKRTLKRLEFFFKF
jgi:hypothetical protein